MKIQRRTLAIILGLLGAFMLTGMAEAGSFTARTKSTNLNMVSWLGGDRVMTLSVWASSTHTVERHGGKPIIQDYEDAGWQLLIRTCAVPAEPCVIEVNLSGELDPDDIVESGGKIRMNAEGIFLECTIARRAKFSSTDRNQFFDGSSEESSFKTHSTEGEGAVSSTEGNFDGSCYGNKSTVRQKAID